MQSILFLGLWLLATGTHWDLIQVGAWTNMLAKNVRVMAWSDALVSTFSPEEMCSMCYAVQSAKSAGNDASALAGQLIEKAPLLTFSRGEAAFYFATDARDWSVPVGASASSWREAPPVPPPRA